MINITDPKARRRYQQQLEALMTRLEITAAREIRPILNRQYFNAASLVKQGVFDVTHAVNLERARLKDRLRKHYRRVAKVANKRIIKALNDIKSASDIETKTIETDFWAEMNAWITFWGAQKVTVLNDTTKAAIAIAIRKGASDGESFPEIAKRIRKAGLVSNTRRARLIARNETHTALVQSMDATVRSTRIKMEREWVSAQDDRTRSRLRGDAFEHFAGWPAGPDGERVAQDKFFRGTGEGLDYPGDPRGSAANTILCRCVILYHTI